MGNHSDLSERLSISVPDLKIKINKFQKLDCNHIFCTNLFSDADNLINRLVLGVQQSFTMIFQNYVKTIFISM